MYKTIQEIKEKNWNLGHHFFDPVTMRFFDSKIETGVINRQYFITSERMDYKHSRKYTI